MLSINNMSKSFDKIIYNNVSYNFNQGKIYFIHGESGAGKTTLLNIIRGVESIDKGTITYNGKILQNLDDKDKISFINEEIMYVKQDSVLFENLTVYDNLRLITNQESIIVKILKDSGLEYCMYDKVRTLSGGEQKRVSVLQTILQKGSILLCDEPTSNLDYETAQDIMNTIISVSEHKLIIIVSHDEDICKEYADVIITINNGKLISKKNNRTRNDLIYQSYKSEKVSFFDLFKLNNKSFILSFKFIIITILFLLLLSFFLFGNYLMKDAFNSFYIEEHDTRIFTTNDFDELDTKILLEESLNELDTVESIHYPLPVVTSVDNVVFEQYFNNYPYHEYTVNEKYLENLALYRVENYDESNSSGDLIENMSYIYDLDSSFSKVMSDYIVAGKMPSSTEEIIINLDAAYFYALYSSRDANIMYYSPEEILAYFDDNSLSFRNYYDIPYDYSYLPNFKELEIVGIVDDSIIENTITNTNFVCYNCRDSEENILVNGYQFKYSLNVYTTSELYDLMYYERISEVHSLDIVNKEELDKIPYNMSDNTMFFSGFIKVFVFKNENSTEKGYFNSISDIMEYRDSYFYDGFGYMCYGQSYYNDFLVYERVAKLNILFIFLVIIFYIITLVIYMKYLDKLMSKDYEKYKDMHLYKSKIIKIYLLRFLVFQIFLFLILISLIYLLKYSLYELVITQYSNMFYMPITVSKINLSMCFILCFIIIVINFIFYTLILSMNNVLKYKKIYISNNVNSE